MKSSDPAVQYLLDRQSIHDCINSHARGLDRHDLDLIVDAYFSDAWDEHGNHQSGPIEFAEWANLSHSQGIKTHTHHITTCNVEIDGDVAHAETYCFFALVHDESTRMVIGSGRYIDKLERREDKWRLAVRKLLLDWRAEADSLDTRGSQSYQSGARNKSDPSYDRPLLPSSDRKGT